MQINPEWAASLVERDLDRDDRRQQLLAEYAKAFEAAFQFVTFLPVRASYESAPKYFLMHATNSSHGYVKMNDVVAKLTETQEVTHIEHQRAGSGQNDLFAVAPVMRVTPRMLEDALLDAVTTGGPKSFIEHRVHLVRAFGEDAREKHHNAALRSLEKKGLVHVARMPGTSNMDNAIVRRLP